MTNQTLPELYNNAKTTTYIKVVGIGVTPLLGVSRQRIAVHFYFNNADYFASLVASDGTNLFAALVNVNRDQHFLLQEHGDLVTNPWSIVAAGAANVHVVEVVADCSCPTGH